MFAIICSSLGFVIALALLIKNKVFEECLLEPIVGLMVITLLTYFLSSMIGSEINKGKSVEYKRLSIENIKAIEGDQFIWNKGFKEFYLVDGKEGYIYSGGSVPSEIKIKYIIEDKPVLEIYQLRYKEEKINYWFKPAGVKIYLFSVPKDKVGTYTITGGGKNTTYYHIHDK